MRMKSKTVIITGGGKGIGFGVATAFAKEGADIVITGRQESALAAAKEKLESAYGIRVGYVAGDLCLEETAPKVVAKAIEMTGRLDVLINNAQASKSGVMLADHTKADFDLAINSGLYATFFMMRAAFPYLKETQGSVINFASGAGLAGRLGQSSYAAAKGINVNVVCPLVETEQLKKWKEEYPDVYAKTIKGVPLGRFGDAEKDIGRTCLFLASEDASYISGETITLQGGSGLRP